MATEGPNLHDGTNYTAAADLSAKQFFAVKQTAARAVNLASTGGEPIIGILQNKPTSGQAADIVFAGQTKAIAGAAFTQGVPLMTDTSGRLITATSTNVWVAIATEAATGANQIVTVMMIPLNQAKMP